MSGEASIDHTHGPACEHTHDRVRDRPHRHERPGAGDASGSPLRAGGRPIVLVGADEDEHVAALRDALRARGANAVVLDTLTFPSSPRIALGGAPEAISVDGVDLGRPGAVYLRSLYISPLSYLVDVTAEMAENWRTTMIVFKEKAELLLSVCRRWEDLDVPMYNPLTASDLTRKPHQISRLAAAGLPVPETLWTNDPSAARAFAERRRIAYKPVSGGAATKELRPEDLDERRLARLANSPVTFQELLPGEDRRVFVLDGKVVAVFRITVEEGTLDYRQHEQSVESVACDESLDRIAVGAAEVLGLRFTGVDLKQAADGTWRLLELNPSPMFLGFDHRAGTDVLGALADRLVSHAQGSEKEPGTESPRLRGRRPRGAAPTTS